MVRAMKIISFIIIVILIASCKQDFNALSEVNRIEQLDFRKMNNIHIKARTKKEGKSIAHFYEENIKGKSNRVANVEYYPYESLDEILKSILKSYTEVLSKNENVENRSQAIFQLFSDINYSEIYGDTQYCECIRFDYNEDTHLYYFENLANVKSELTQSKLEKAKRIKEHWYLVVD